MRRLLLLRHAKAEPAAVGGDDHARPLIERGRDDACLIAQYMRSQELEPDLILSSSSKRTVETAEIVTTSLVITPPVDILDTLYLAEPDVMLAVVRGSPEKVRTAMLVGHNPGMEQLAAFLAREPVKRKERDRFDRIEEKFPTAALAVLDFDVPRWRDIAPGQGALKDFVRPRDL